MRVWIALFCLFSTCSCWFQWNYTVDSGESGSNEEKVYQGWQETFGMKNGPGNRTGHSFAMFGTKLIMFGGKSNEVMKKHDPTRYKIERKNGTLQFTDYEASICDSAEDSTCDNQVETAVYLNDVWEYDLDCGRPRSRYPCENGGWEIIHPGAVNGGCAMILGTEVCSVPFERWSAKITMFADDTLYVYGGFSHRCEDYCDDIWMFNILKKSWSQIFALGKLSGPDYGIGKRWRFSSVSFVSPIDNQQKMVIFGGHRIWHGFASKNSEKNRWNDYTEIPFGGYMNDLWIFTKNQINDFSEIDAFFVHGTWEKVEPKEECQTVASSSWGSQEMTCSTMWPSPRSGHAAAYDKDQNVMWVFGGYATYFPYLVTHGIGSGPGISTVGKGGFTPYPLHEYFLNDLWYFDFNTSLWSNVIVNFGNNPLPRFDAAIVIADRMLYVYGGYTDNNYLDDVWLFNTSYCALHRPFPPLVHYCSNWLKKESFVDAIFPETCTEDVISDMDDNCTLLVYPKQLERQFGPPFDVLPYREQDYTVPKDDVNYFTGLILDDATKYTYKSTTGPRYGTMLVPYAATGPRQYVRDVVIYFSKEILNTYGHPMKMEDIEDFGSYVLNDSHLALVHEWCLSVKAEPTRGERVDGRQGRSRQPVLIPQPRKMAPGWDGCRDRYDDRTDLPQQLQWRRPSQRAGHDMIFFEEFNEIIVFGGRGYDSEMPYSLKDTPPTKAFADMWVLGIHDCPNDCYNHGTCYHGYCFCDDGYYGLDCSNSSCAGSFCYYEPTTNEQICNHCCQAGYKHKDNDTYAGVLVEKLECSLELHGESHGICDGWGTCQCSPPFLGDDCSIKDCANNCSFNGWCSLEYPVSRCMCQPGYFGETCEFKNCLNNCSYPNGVCNETSGECDCRDTYSPFNNTRPYSPFFGEDCSYIVAYCGAIGQHMNILMSLALAFLLCALFFIQSM